MDWKKLLEDYENRKLYSSQPSLDQELNGPLKDRNMEMTRIGDIASSRDNPFSEVEELISRYERITPKDSITEIPKSSTKSSMSTSAEHISDKSTETVPTTLEPYKPKEDKEVKEAMDRDRVQAFISGLNEAGAIIASGLTRGEFKPNLESYRYDNNELKRLQAAREVEAKGLDVQMEKEAQDPASPLSVAMRESLKKLGVDVPDNMSYAGLQKSQFANTAIAAQARREAMAQRNMEFALRRQELQANREQRQAENEKNRNLRFDQATASISSKLMSDLKKIEDSAKGVGEARTLLSSAKAGNTLALSALGTKLAKAMGDVGALSDTDVSRYVTSPKLAQKLKDLAGKKFKGRLSVESAEELSELTAALERENNERRNTYYDKYATIMSQTYGLPLEDSYRRLGDPRFTADVAKEREELLKKYEAPKQKSFDFSKFKKVE